MSTPADTPSLSDIAAKMIVDPTAATEKSLPPIPPTRAATSTVTPAPATKPLPPIPPKKTPPKAPTPATDPLADAVTASRSVPTPQKISYKTPIARPNGDLYYPRRLKAGPLDAPLYDVQMLRDARTDGLFVLFTGPPGTGKTALVEAALPDVITVPGTADTEVADFLGSYVQLPDGSYQWVDGPLLEAMESGRPLFIDEIALIDPRVLAVVYSVMDGRGELRVTINPTRGTVQAAPGFYIVAACNPNVPGAMMSDALLSRFPLKVEVPTDYDLCVSLGVLQEIVTVAQNLATKAVTGEVFRAPETRDLLSFQTVHDRFGLEIALANFVGAADPNDRQEYATTVRSTFSTDVRALHV